MPTRLSLLALTCGLFLVGCSDKKKPDAQEDSDAPQGAPEEAAGAHDDALARLLSPPEEHVATPMPILARRFQDGYAGDVEGLSDHSQKLSHMGLGRCLDGWVLLGYTPEKSVLEPIYITKNFLPIAQLVITPDQHPYKESITLNLKSASKELLEGSATVLREGKKKAESWTFKTKPEQLAAANNMGHLGCHHTGFAKITMGSKTVNAPVRSQYKAPGQYRISVALNPTHRVEIWFDLPDHKRGRGHRITADLAKLLAAPADFQQRVIFEYLDPTGVYVRTPAKEGTLEVHFQQDKTGGPVVFKLNGLKAQEPWPEYKEAMEALPMDIKGFVEFSTDRMGRQVPIHRIPQNY